MFLVSVTVSLHVFENVRYFEVLFRFVSRISVFSSSPLFNHLLMDVFSYVVPVPGFNDVKALSDTRVTDLSEFTFTILHNILEYFT